MTARPQPDPPQVEAEGEEGEELLGRTGAVWGWSWGWGWGGLKLGLWLYLWRAGAANLQLLQLQQGDQLPSQLGGAENEAVSESSLPRPPLSSWPGP